MSKYPGVIFIALCAIALAIIIPCEHIWKYNAEMCSTIVTPSIFIGFVVGLLALVIRWKKKAKQKIIRLHIKNIQKPSKGYFCLQNLLMTQVRLSP